nr:O-antigen ligase family protein [Phycisphaerales bacterium]
MSRAISPRTPGLVDSDKVGAASLVASLAMGTLVCIKMLTTYDPLPGWGSDPTLHDAALGVSLSPDLQVAINAAITLLAGLVFVLTGHPAGKFPASAAGSFLLAVTLGSLLYHMAFNRSATIEDWTAGSDLIAAVCAGAACVRLDPAGSSHRALVALLAGVVVLVAIKGALQYSVEHGQTVRAYMDSREQILAANGWLPDSPSALAYERRLFQREPTGWFGLSNIFASVVGAGLVGLAGLALAANSLAARAVLWSAALLGGVMLILTLSKGGLIATAAGIGVLGALLMLRHQAHRSDSNRRITSRAWQLTPWAFVALVVAGQAVIALRGFLSTGISELSLLFRWFYVQGAARIIADNPLTGVGPAGFKDAYLIAKPPISPEDVASPHSLPWDFTSALGVGGVAMTVLWITWVWMAGRSAARSAARHDAPVREVMPGVVTNPADSHPAAGATVRLIALAAVTAVIASVWIEREATTPEIAAMKLVGMAAWIAVSLSAWGAARHAAAAIPLAAAAAVLALHAQVEMTPVWIGSSAWFMAIIGLAASGGCPSTCSHGEP